MSFNVRVSFTGLIGFVKNSNATGYPPMCALAVDGSRPRRALDGTALCVHRSFLRFPIGLVANAGAESYGIWNFNQENRERIYFDVEEEHPTEPKLVLNETPFPGLYKPDLTDPECRTSLTWMLDMTKLFDNFKVHPDALKATPSPEANVGVQVVIDRGVLLTGAFTRAVWNCDKTLSSKPQRLVFTHVVDLFIGGLKEARIVSVNIDTGAQRVLDLSKLPQGGANEVSVRMFNVCNLNPLEWSPIPAPEPDQDTKWFFEILEPKAKEKLKNRLGLSELPIPKPDEPFNPGTFGSPGSGNCIPPKAGSSSFDLPKLVKSPL